MNIITRSFFGRSLLAIMVVGLVVTTFQIQPAEAKHRRTAIVAGAIIGGALLYHQYKRHRKYHRQHRVRYYNYHRPRYRHRHYHGHGHYHYHYHRHGGDPGGFK